MASLPVVAANGAIALTDDELRALQSMRCSSTTAEGPGSSAVNVPPSVVTHLIVASAASPQPTVPVTPVTAIPLPHARIQAMAHPDGQSSNESARTAIGRDSPDNAVRAVTHPGVSQPLNPLVAHTTVNPLASAHRASAGPTHVALSPASYHAPPSRLNGVHAGVELDTASLLHNGNGLEMLQALILKAAS